MGTVIGWLQSPFPRLFYEGEAWVFTAGIYQDKTTLWASMGLMDSLGGSLWAWALPALPLNIPFTATFSIFRSGNIQPATPGNSNCIAVETHLKLTSVTGMGRKEIDDASNFYPESGDHLLADPSLSQSQVTIC